MSSVSSSTSTTSTSSSSSSSNATQVLANTDKFLTLLMKELENQDPTNPVDATTYTNQLFQVAQLSQSVANGQKLDSIETLISQTTFSNTAVGYLGHKVEAEGSTTSLADGTATWSYDLSGDAATVSLMVEDSDGNVIYSTTGDKTSGTHTFTWDGTESSGSTASDGEYTLKVKASGSSGSTVTATTYISGTVTSVDNSDGDTLLDINGVTVGLGSVVQLY